MNLKNVFRLTGVMIFLSGAGIFCSAGAGSLMHDNIQIVLRMLLCGFFLIIAGGLIVYCFRKSKSTSMDPREAFAIVAFSWFSAVLASTFLYYFAGNFLFEDALFESASGFSTTGATVVDPSFTLRSGKTLTDGIEGLPYGLLFWRALSNRLGGMGIVVFSLVVLPFLGIRSQQLYNAEVPGLKMDSDRFVPSAARAAKILWFFYTGIMVIELVLFRLGGMTFFDAVCHAFSVGAAGGFSTKNASIAYYHSPFIEWVCIFSMLFVSCNFTLSIKLLMTGKLEAFRRDEEFRIYIVLIFAAIAAIALQLIFSGGNTLSWSDNLRSAAFQVTSISSSTGFSTVNYNEWPLFSKMILFLLMFMGGCAGSAAGGMKCVRVLLFFKHAKSEVIRCIFPRALNDIRLNEKRMENTTVNKCIAFLLLYFAIFLVVSALLPLLCEMDMVTALSSSVACLSNIGPGFSMTGPASSFGWMNAPAKLLLSFVMILGRLELYAILVLFLPSFWKK